MNPTWQQKAANFARTHGLLHDPATHALDLASEVGEVAKEILRVTEYGRQSFAPDGPRLEAELGDALYSLLVLGEACDIELGGALDLALAKYEQRLEQHGRARSSDE
jgi:NTP pyrophosphatase (non-canonical NTP hydrolase)